MGRIGTRASAAMLSAMLFAPVLAKAWTPTLEERATAARLEESLPRQFGEWHAIPGDISQAELSVAADGRKSDDQPYDDVLMRTYVNQSGEKIMLAVAYAREQRQDVKLHLPEGCYPAQGYKVLALTPVALRVGADGTRLPGKHMLASGHGRLEAVTYWTRISDAYPQGGLAMRIKIFLDGLHGIVSDGVLVRSSMIVADAADAANAHAVQEDFLRALVAAGRPQTRVLVVEYANARP
jgi:EpsI family protein